jgi:release factor glutamine methyltransferase
MTHASTLLTDQQCLTLDEALQRLQNGEPLPYITGRQEFFGLSFLVNANVLIPRPETESLVELTSGWLTQHPQYRKGVDLGTGSGCIAVSLCKQFHNLHMTAIDISAAALETARQNAVNHHVDQQITFELADLLSSIYQPIDFLCANLPYIPEQQLQTLEVAKHEPNLALNGGIDGFHLIAQTLEQCRLREIPFMIFEMDISHTGLAIDFAKRQLPDAKVKIQPDLSGRERFLIIESF